MRLAGFPLSAQANRVHVLDGHTICLSVVLDRPARPSEVERAMEGYRPEDPEWPLIPSAPPQVIRARNEKDRPQPRRDRGEGKGLTTVVGRVRPDPVMESIALGGPVVPVQEGSEDAPRRAFKMVVCSHNTVMGAAGSSLLNAELATAKGVLLPMEEARARGEAWLKGAVGRYVHERAAQRDREQGGAEAAAQRVAAQERS